MILHGKTIDLLSDYGISYAVWLILVDNVLLSFCSADSTPPSDTCGFPQCFVT